MPASASWYQQGRIIYATVEGNLTMDEVVAVNQMVTQLLQEGQAPVHLIVDASKLDKFPIDLKRFASATSYLKEPHLGKMAVISNQGGFVKFFASIITQAARIEMKMFDKVEDGLTFFRRVDFSLQDITVP